MAVIAKPASKLTDPYDDPQAVPPQYSDEALALRFADAYADRLRYVAKWDQWFCFDGVRWVKDEVLRATLLARQVCRCAAAELGNMPAAQRIASARTTAAVQRLAPADKRLAATFDQWDSDPWVLNTPKMVIDLRTGKPRPHNPTDYCTKVMAVSPYGTCPLWLNFLTKIFNGDDELITYMQRLAGYVLTGRTDEHALFFLHGLGANGKSTLVNTLLGILGDYSITAPMETFTASNQDRHPTELAMLQGARLVTAQETEEGRRWAEARIKAITGGDPITARYVRQDNFTFIPVLKLIVVGNHKPGLRGVDEAIRRRMNLIPFSVTIPEAERDPTLVEKLKAEWPGILVWMIEGCLKWQAVGLKPPPAVQSATGSYLEAEDTLRLWLAECCIMEPDAWESSAKLFASWKAWAETASEYVGSQKRFVQAMEGKGFMSVRKSKARGLAGVRLAAASIINSTPVFGKHAA